MKKQKLPLSLGPIKKLTKLHQKTPNTNKIIKQISKEKLNPSVKPNIRKIDQQKKQQTINNSDTAKQNMKKDISIILNTEQTKYFQGDPDISGYSVSDEGEKVQQKNQILCQEDKKYFSNMKHYISSLINQAIGYDIEDKDAAKRTSSQAQNQLKEINNPIELKNYTRNKQENAGRRITEMRSNKNITSLDASIKKKSHTRITGSDINKKISVLENQCISAKWKLNEKQKNKIIQEDIREEIFKNRPKINNTPSLNIMGTHNQNDGRQSLQTIQVARTQKIEKRVKIKTQQTSKQEKQLNGELMPTKDRRKQSKQQFFPKIKPKVQYCERSKTIDLISDINHSRMITKQKYSNFGYSPVTLNLVNPELSSKTIATSTEQQTIRCSEPQINGNEGKVRKCFGFNRKLRNFD